MLERITDDEDELDEWYNPDDDQRWLERVVEVVWCRDLGCGGVARRSLPLQPARANPA